MAITTQPPKVSADIASNDALIDLYMERAIDLIRLEAGTRDKVWALLQTLELDIIKSINNIDIRGVDAAGHQRNRLAKLLDVVRASIQATYRGANTLMGRELREVADIEGTWTANAINAATHAEFADSGVTRGFLATLATDVLIQGAPSKDWWGRQAAGLADRFADEMRRGVLLGENNSELVDRVRGPGKIMDVSRTSAERLVRASVQTVANAAREETYANNTDLIASLQWHATLDTRTSIWCITRDGHQYTPVDHEPIGEAPPWLEGPGALHWGCRSTSVPILKSWKELGIDEAEVPKTTRASMDGQVPENLTFEAWLKKQSIARQDTVLGKGKADLWRAGKITFRDLLDQNGRPLTTEELRAKAKPTQRAAYVIVDHVGQTSFEFRNNMENSVSQLPANIKKILFDAGERVVVARNSVTEAIPELRGIRPRGYPEGQTWENVSGVHTSFDRKAVVSEYYLDPESGTWVKNRRPEAVLHHEIGHAFDNAKGRVSASSIFSDAYQQDVAALSPSVRAGLKYFLQEGIAGPQEAFAELFANALGFNAAYARIAFYFPRSFAVVKKAMELT